MLTRAVCDDDKDTEGTAEILDSLGLTGTGGASGGATVAHAEGLAESDVAPLSESRDTKTLLGTEELILISEVNIGDANDSLAVLAILSSPVEAGVLLPVEIGNIFEVSFLTSILDSLEEILLVDLNGYKGLNFSPDKFVGKIFTAHSGKIVHHCVDLDVLSLERLLSILLPLKAVSHLLSKHELDTEKGNLRLVLANELHEGELEALGSGAHDNGAHGLLHGALELAKPILDVAFAFDGIVESNRLS